MHTLGERAQCADGEEDRGALPDGVEGDGRAEGGRVGGAGWRMMESLWVDADLTGKLRCSLYVIGRYPSTLWCSSSP